MRTLLHIFAPLALLSAATGQHLIHEQLGLPDDALGSAIAGPGDLDSDGRAELAASDPFDSRAGTEAGRVEVRTAADGGLRFVLLSSTGQRFGWSLAGGGDFDGDGVPDYAAGSAQVGGFSGPGRVDVFSGADHSWLYGLRGQEINDKLYRSTRLGDANGDGVDDFAVSGPGDSDGIVRTFSHVCLPEESSRVYCTSDANSTGAPAQMSFRGSVSVAADNLVLRAAPVPDQTGLFFYGAQRARLPLGNGTRCVGGRLFRLPPSAAVGGELLHTLDLEALGSGVGGISPGSVWNFQAWFRDPAAGGAGFDTSDGLALRFCD
jgi:hypothetical protein